MMFDLIHKYLHECFLLCNYFYQSPPKDAKSYEPDTWDLTDDLESRSYWLNTFKESTTKTAKIGKFIIDSDYEIFEPILKRQYLKFKSQTTVRLKNKRIVF